MAQQLLRFICLLVVAIIFASADPSKNHAKPGEFPHAVSINFGSSHYCGGSIISPRHILTAGHCVYFAKDGPIQFMTVVSGTINSNQGGVVHKVARAILHPKYNLTEFRVTWNNDVGILELEQPIEFNEFQKPIGLPTEGVEPNTEAVMSGWGQGVKNSQPSEIMQKLIVKTISNEDCTKALRRDISNSAFCTMTQSSGICTRESGSPLTHGSTVIGVVSASIPCSLAYPDIFANVYENMDFITQVLADK